MREQIILAMGGEEGMNPVTDANNPEPPARHQFEFAISPISRCRLVTLSLLALCLAGCDGYFNYSGYCKAQDRHLSDEEFIQIAVRDQANTSKMEIERSEASIRDFHKNNPKCCDVDRTPFTQTLFDRLMGSYLVDVEVNYKIVEDDWNEIGKYYEAHVMIRPCGKVVGFYGTGTEVLRQIGDKH